PILPSKNRIVLFKWLNGFCGEVVIIGSPRANVLLQGVFYLKVMMVCLVIRERSRKVFNVINLRLCITGPFFTNTYEVYAFPLCIDYRLVFDPFFIFLTFGIVQSGFQLYILEFGVVLWCYQFFGTAVVKGNLHAPFFWKKLSKIEVCN